MNRISKSAAFLIITTIVSLRSMAQEKGLDVSITVNKKDSLWYQLPWVWVLGGAVFILLLVAMLRTSGKKAK